LVQPDHRRRGLGNALLSWCITEARTLFASRDTAGEKKLYLRSEFVTASALRLYEGHGFILDHAADVMRRDLNIPLPESNLPKGISLDTWSDKAAADFFAAYHAAFRERPGYPEWSAEFWISRAKDDADFSPERSFVAYDGGTPVGFITCFNDYVGQVGVHPAWRKRGLGSALLVETLQRVARAGGNAVWLDVNVNNPDAARVYAQLGFDCVGRRGTYALTL
jgi:mycothiol synthase